MLAAVVALVALFVGPLAGAFPRPCIVSGDVAAAPVSCGCQCSKEAKAAGGCCCQTTAPGTPAEPAGCGTAVPSSGAETCPSEGQGAQHSSCPCQLRPAPSDPATTLAPAADRLRWAVHAAWTSALLPAGWAVAAPSSLAGSYPSDSLWASGSQIAWRPDAGRAPPAR